MIIPVIRDGRGRLTRNYKIRDWYEKLNEELNEVKVAVWDYENYACNGDYDEDDGVFNVAEELQDLKTVCTSMLTWLNCDKTFEKQKDINFGLISYKWIRTLDRYLDEVKTAESVKVAEKLAALIAVCESMQIHFCVLDDKAVDKICAKVNEKNKKRGYFEED